MFLGAGISTWLLPAHLEHAEPWVAIAAVGSFFLSLGAIQKFQYLLLLPYRARPVVLEKLKTSEETGRTIFLREDCNHMGLGAEAQEESSLSSILQRRPARKDAR